MFMRARSRPGLRTKTRRRRPPASAASPSAADGVKSSRSMSAANASGGGSSGPALARSATTPDPLEPSNPFDPFDPSDPPAAAARRRMSRCSASGPSPSAAPASITRSAADSCARRLSGSSGESVPSRAPWMRQARRICSGSFPESPAGPGRAAASTRPPRGIQRARRSASASGASCASCASCAGAGAERRSFMSGIITARPCEAPPAPPRPFPDGACHGSPAGRGEILRSLMDLMGLRLSVGPMRRGYAFLGVVPWLECAAQRCFPRAAGDPRNSTGSS